MKYGYRHVHGCGNIAFHLDHKPVDGQLIEAKGVTLLDGSKPLDGTFVVCGVCQKTIQFLNAKDVEDIP